MLSVLTNTASLRVCVQQVGDMHWILAGA